MTYIVGDFGEFLVRTCHQLSVQLRLADFSLDSDSKATIENLAKDGPVKIVLFEYCTVCFVKMNVNKDSGRGIICSCVADSCLRQFSGKVITALPADGLLLGNGFCHEADVEWS